LSEIRANANLTEEEKLIKDKGYIGTLIDRFAKGYGELKEEVREGWHRIIDKIMTFAYERSFAYALDARRDLRCKIKDDHKEFESPCRVIDGPKIDDDGIFSCKVYFEDERVFESGNWRVYLNLNTKEKQKYTIRGELNREERIAEFKAAGFNGYEGVELVSEVLDVVALRISSDT
jgi:hypothetical protein